MLHLRCSTVFWIRLCILPIFNFWKWSLAGKRLEKLPNEFLQMFGETLPSKLLFLRKKSHIISWRRKLNDQKWLQGGSNPKSLSSATNNQPWLNVHLRTKWLWVRVPLQSLKLQIFHLFGERSSLPFRQITIECGFTLKHVRDMIRTFNKLKFLFTSLLKTNK